MSDEVFSYSERAYVKRISEHYTLGELIAALERAVVEFPEAVLRYGFGHPHSYRGYYMDLAFEPVENVAVTDFSPALCTSRTSRRPPVKRSVSATSCVPNRQRIRTPSARRS